MQESKNCELLFEYLRSILYDAKIETLNIFDLDEPYRKLGQGLQFLENAIGEMKSYSEALSHGNLSVDTHRPETIFFVKTSKTFMQT